MSDGAARGAHGWFSRWLLPGLAFKAAVIGGGLAVAQMSELWCATQPGAPYISRAMRAPVSASSPIMRSSGSTHSASALASAGQ